MFKRVVMVSLLSLGAIASADAQIVALGASSTARCGVGAAAAYPAQLLEILRAKGRPMSVIAAGVSGDTSAGMLAMLSGAVPAGTRIVILQIAGNDAMKGISPAAAGGEPRQNPPAAACPGHSHCRSRGLCARRASQRPAAGRRHPHDGGKAIARSPSSWPPRSADQQPCASKRRARRTRRGR